MQQLMISFEGAAAPREILDGVQRGTIASFCLFGHLNSRAPAPLRELTESLRHAAQLGGQPVPLLGIDQEGGQLMAVVGGATELPGNMALGATRSPELAEQAGRVLGRELLAMGINLNFAPSLDVNVNPANPVVGTRSFGADPALVTELGLAMIRGMQAEGVIATAKHFPGHGDTGTDPHHAHAVVSHPLERIEAVELHPFRTAIQAGVKAIMTAHILFTALDDERPATISQPILTGYLRERLGFEGVLMTDAMDMHAVARYGREASVRMALEAGADLVLLGHLPGQMELIRDLAPLARPAAQARIAALRAQADRPLPDFDVIGCAAHQQIAQTIADRAITLVRDAGRLPLRLAPDAEIVVITPEPVDLTPADTSSHVTIALADAIRQRHPRTRAYELPHRAGPDEIAALLHAVEDADTVIVGTISADQHAGQTELVRALHARGQCPIVIALRTPYDLAAFPMIETYLCAYSIRPVAVEAAARVLFGEIEATGVLPGAIPESRV